MITTLNEVTYSPLSLRETFKVRLEAGICFIKTERDEHLEIRISLKGPELVLEVEKNNTKDPTSMILVSVEYLLTHLEDLARVSLLGASELGYPFSVLGHRFERSEFFQLPTLWHHTQSYQITPERWVQTNERPHPVRPRPATGTVYKRYVPSIQKTISFRLADPEKDLEQFHEWHNQSRVSFYWELNKPKEELKAYLEKGLKDPHQIPLIVEIDGDLVGYYEMYWVREDRLGPYYESDAFDRGFHFLIGNKRYLGKEITDGVVKSGLHLLYLDEARTRRIMAEPRHDNQKVLKYAEASIGWKKLKVFDFPHKRAVLLENSREVFFGGNAL